MKCFGICLCQTQVTVDQLGRHVVVISLHSTNLLIVSLHFTMSCQSQVLGWLDLCVASDNVTLRNDWPIVICHVCCCVLLNCGKVRSTHSWLDWDIEVVVVDARGTAMGMEGCVGQRETFMSLVTENVDKISVPSNEM